MDNWNMNLNKFIKGNSFTIIAIMIVSALGGMIFDIPEVFLDILIGCNICFSLIILFTSMKVSKPTEFSVLPALLLFTTIFRLSVNVASTKSILENGSAGKLVQAFGSFVVRGNVLVGVIAFLIIILVQFLVIGKGSERISEVAARFTLDGLSLKFMAVEGELNQGLIDANEAQRRRDEIQKNADFYGSMDGAIKFVKNDTIAGLIITTINIVAGLISGMMTLNLTFTESLSKYTLLTIGDGLLSIIPSLLISAATGIIVTRPYTQSDVGSEIFSQIGKNAGTFYITGAIFALFALIPGVNKLVFLGLSGALATIGYFIQKTDTTEITNEVTTDTAQEETEKDYSEEYNAIGLEIQLGYGLINLANSEQGGQLLSKLEKVREKTLKKLGFLIPPIKTRDNLNLAPHEYRILINGLTVGKYEIEIGKLLAISPTQDPIDLEGIDTLEPAYEFRAKWIDKELAKVAENKGYTTVDSIDLITSHLENLAVKHSHEILTREMTKELVGYVEQKNPTIVKELIPNILTLAQVQMVLENLLREGVSIKNLNLILEALGNNAHLDKDPATLTEFARARLKKEIIESLEQGDEVYYIGFTYDSEEIIRNSIIQNSLYTQYLALKPDVSDNFMKQLQNQAEFAISNGKMPVIMCSTSNRFYLAKYLEPKIPFIKVLSTEELLIPEIKTIHVGNIDLTTLN